MASDSITEQPVLVLQVPMPVRPMAMSMEFSGPANGNTAGHLQLQPSFPPLQSTLGVHPSSVNTPTYVTCDYATISITGVSLVTVIPAIIASTV